MSSLNNTFHGFSPEMLDFLIELKYTNTIDRQAENIIKYKRLISQPLMLLYGTLLDTVLDMKISVETRYSRCVSTPYTDRRFSHNVPLKEYMYIRFKQCDKETDIAGLHFDLGIEHYGYGIRIYKQTAHGMDKLRERIKEKPKEYSEIIEKIYSDGFKVVGVRYKKDHFPEISECKAKDILNCRRFHIEKAVPVGDNIFSSALADEISEAYRHLGEFYKVLEEL